MYFAYGKKIYQQITGGAMGSSFTLNSSQYFYVGLANRN